MRRLSLKNENKKQTLVEDPLEELLAENTEFKLCGEKIYLFLTLDLFNDEIVTCILASKPSYSLVSTMLN